MPRRNIKIKAQTIIICQNPSNINFSLNDKRELLGFIGSVPISDFLNIDISNLPYSKKRSYTSLVKDFFPNIKLMNYINIKPINYNDIIEKLYLSYHCPLVGSLKRLQYFLFEIVKQKPELLSYYIMCGGYNETPYPDMQIGITGTVELKDNTNIEKPTEAIETCAIREAWEELGLKLSKKSLLFKNYQKKGGLFAYLI